MMEHDKKLVLAKAQHVVSKKKETERRAEKEAEAGQLSAFISDLDSLLARGIHIDGADNVDLLVRTTEKFGQRVSELLNEIRTRTASLDELNIPDTIQLKQITDPNLLDALKNVGDNGELLSKVQTLDQSILLLRDAIVQIKTPEPAKQGQSPKDYVPVRIVEDIDGKLRWFKQIQTPSFIGVNSSGGGTTGGATEAKQDVLIGHVDSLETLVGLTNTALGTIDGRVDGLETLVTATNAALATLNAAQKTDWGLNDQEETGTYKYFGFESPSGSWKITRKTLATSSFRYATGPSDYSTAWTDRATQTYDTYGVTF